MKRLTILFDVHCAFCRNCRQWMGNQPAYLELEFMSSQSPTARERYPELTTPFGQSGERSASSPPGGGKCDPCGFTVPEIFNRGGQKMCGKCTEKWEEANVEKELLVIDDQGGVYRGDAAWLMCLWALRKYRGWSLRLATPVLHPMARAAFKWISTHRGKIPAWLSRMGMGSPEPERNGPSVKPASSRQDHQGAERT